MLISIFYVPDSLLSLVCLTAVWIAICIVSFFIILTVYIYMTGSEPDLSCHETEKSFINVDASTNGRTAFPSLEDGSSVSLSVIVPAYNEEERLSLMMDEALTYLSSRQSRQPSFSYEVIVVDDGSTDRTTEEALKYSSKWGAEKVRILTLVKNKGKGGAVRMGMLRARGQLLLFADADGATKFADIEKLEKELSVSASEGSTAISVGSRAHLQEESIAQRSIFRTILMYGFHFLVWSLSGVRGVRDTQCGFKMFTRAAARLVFVNLHIERWAFDIELLYIAQYFNIPISEVPVTWTEIPGSKLSPIGASLQMARDLFVIRLRYLTGSWKIVTKPNSRRS